MKMNRSDGENLNQVVQAYFAHCSKKASRQEKKASAWAYDLVCDWTYEKSGESLWTFVLFAYPLEMTDEVKAVFAAGPVEDLLAKFGEQYIEKVEDLARRDPKFNDILGGVWQNTMSDEVWQRVQKVRNSVW